MGLVFSTQLRPALYANWLQKVLHQQIWFTWYNRGNSESITSFWNLHAQKNEKITLFTNVKGYFYFVPVSKRVLVQNLSWENEFELHENEPVGEAYFHMNGLAQRLVLTQRQNGLFKHTFCFTCLCHVLNVSYCHDLWRLCSITLSILKYCCLMWALSRRLYRKAAIPLSNANEVDKIDL